MLQVFSSLIWTASQSASTKQVYLFFILYDYKLPKQNLESKRVRERQSLRKKRRKSTNKIEEEK